MSQPQNLLSFMAKSCNHTDERSGLFHEQITLALKNHHLSLFPSSITSPSLAQIAPFP